MKTPMLKICIPLALAFAAGCATQSGTESSGGAPANDKSSSTASSSGTNSGSMRGTPGSNPSMAAGQPGEHSVFFEFDKSALTPQDRKVVEAHAQYLKEHPDLKVRVEGNTDERGSKEYNLALGQRRAETVTKVMKLLGVKDQRVEAVSYGEEKPRAEGHD